MDIDFPEHSDEDEAICPYCHAGHYIESEDHNEDEWEMQCQECGKKFWIRQSYTVIHYTKGDCELNGEKHCYRKLREKSKFVHCTLCGDTEIYKENDNG